MVLLSDLTYFSVSFSFSEKKESSSNANMETAHMETTSESEQLIDYLRVWNTKHLNIMCLTYTYPSCIKTLKKCANKEKQPLQSVHSPLKKKPTQIGSHSLKFTFRFCSGGKYICKRK